VPPRPCSSPPVGINRCRISAPSPKQFALTPAERRVLGLLLAGATVADAAQTLGVTIPTMRSHLARLFGKTGTTRQSELLSLAWQLTPPTPTA
jgi:DNA-binding CsgD family transcriptional regulator